MKELESASVTKEQYENMTLDEKLKMAAMHIGCDLRETRGNSSLFLETYEFMMGFN